MSAEADCVFGPFRLDPVGRQLWRGAVAVPLRPKLLAALHYLVTNPGRLIPREELLRAVWSRTHVDETLLRGTMRDLRAVLGDDAEAPRFIETIPHHGYRFLADVQRGPVRPPQGAPGAPDRLDRRLLEREGALAHLERRLDRALQRQRQMVFVTGEPGIGKTALLDAFVETLPQRHGVLVGRGQCVEQYGGSEAYLPVLDAIQQLCRQREGKRVMATLHQCAPTWLLQLPSLLQDADVEALRRKTQGAGRDRMLREMAEALDALSLEKPVALVLEDLHWSDHSTLALLGVLARRREPARLMVVGTYRPTDVIVSGHPLRGFAQELAGRGLSDEVALGFLSAEAVHQYLIERFGVAADDAAFAALADTVHRRTDGNPLFIVSVTDDLVARGVIVPGDGAWRVTGSMAQVNASVPDGLRQFIDRQLERLPDDDQRMLEAASVVGRVFEPAAVAAALGAPGEAVDDRCGRLVGRGVFIEEAPGMAYAFLHDLYRHALYDRLPLTGRTRLHRRVAELEAQASPAQIRDRAAHLAVHFERGGDPARAIEHLKQAAANALKRQAIQETVDLLQHALTLLATLPPGASRDAAELGVQTLLTNPLMLVKGYAAPEVSVVVARARELSERLPPGPALLSTLLGMARFQCVRGELDDAAALCDRIVALAEHAPDPIPLVADSVVVYVSVFRGDLLTTRRHAEHGAAAYDLTRHGALTLTYGNDAGLVCLGFGAWALWGLGYADQASAGIAAAIDLARRLEIPYCDAVALFYASWLHLFTRNVDAAAASLDALESLSTQLGLRQFLAERTALRGWLALQRGGEVTGAIARLEQGLAEHRQTGARLMTPWILACLAEALDANGQATRAHATVDEAVGLATTTGELMPLMHALVVKGDLLASSGDDAPAAESFERAIAVAQRQSARSMELRAATRLAGLLRRQGKPADARALLARVHGSFTEGFDTPDLCEARALLEQLDRPAPRTRRATR